ncbi:ABC transporter substrate-binding protein [Thalassomonas viridans]|uniref:ABC transporter substrate-binding protein n=1 Tax=Thalassomonas viridans TaxID=137584 RepID=A0AAE9Z1A1_9GAMM|nr:ABC transporter substrate-binding protein [Thalassomonas viridans]WDE04205.1 ABC transporter substrate-binding protein [Thalassomonas viridans]
MRPKLLIFQLMLICFLSPLAAAPDNNGGPAPVVIALNNWTSQRVLSHVIGSVIAQQGIEVRYQEVAVADQWGALSKNIIDLQLEVWQESMSEEFASFVNRGLILDLGAHQAKGREEWWYPDYVENLCPGLPDWQALRDCFTLFSTSSSQGKGVLYAGPWDRYIGPRIRALKLNFIIKRFDDDHAIWRMLRQAIAREHPIVIYNWTPNWTDSRLSGKFIDFPPFHDDCYTRKGWGGNPGMLMDCGAPVAGWIKKVASRRFKKFYPCLYQALGKVDFTPEMIADASVLVVVDNLSESEAASRWRTLYAKQLQSWFDLACFGEVKRK